MKAATIYELKNELKHITHQELVNYCLQLAKFKKENKELLTYILFDSKDEDSFIKAIQLEIDNHFNHINTSNYYFIKKSVRKILRLIKKFVRYSKKNETEVELLLYFCFKLKALKPSIEHNKVLQNIYFKQFEIINKKVALLHEDLQFDYGEQLKKL